MSPLVLLAILTQPQRLTEVDRVQAFYQAAHRGLNGKVLPPLDDAPPKLDLSLMKELDRRVWTFPNAKVFVDARTSGIVGYAGFGSSTVGPSAPRRRITDAQAKAQARRFYAASGRPYGIEFFGKVLDRSGTNEDCVQLDFVPTLRGVAFDRAFGGTILIDRVTGQIQGFYNGIPDLPTPPRSLMPRIAPKAARLAAFRTVLGLYGGSLEEADGMNLHLCIWRPNLRQNTWTHSFPTPTLQADEAANRGRLAYAVGFRDMRYDSPQRGVVQSDLYIDALDGKVLAIRRSVVGRTESKAIALPSGVRSWRVSTGGAWSDATRSTLRPIVSSGTLESGSAVLLTDEEVAFAARYDASSGLITIEQADGSLTAYKPDEALADLLRKGTRPKDGTSSGR